MAKEKNLCREFQNGTCRRGNKCKFRHEMASGSDGSNSASKKDIPCPYLTKGSCKMGNKCWFSHRGSASQNVNNEHGSQDTKSDDRDARASAYDEYVQWRYDIPPSEAGIRKSRPLHDRLGAFLEEGLRLMNAGADTMQEVIGSLASPGGLARLDELLKSDLDSLSDPALRKVFQSQLLPLMCILSHESLIASTIMEARHIRILNHMYGPNGARAASIFRAIVRGLCLDDGLASLEPCLMTFSAVLEHNTASQVDTNIRPTAETMLELATGATFSGSALKDHTRMCIRLGMADRIKDRSEEASRASAHTRPTFNVKIDQPGELSSDGPRHDNDSGNINDIQILPTVEEIRSDRAEYLPREQPLSWHKAGFQGLLDRHFRLVREDTVGQLRDAAKFELDRLQDPRLKLLKHQGARTFNYHNVRHWRTEFDEQKGLICVLAFDQPHQLHNKSDRQRREWWDESKRLGPEALVVLLGSDGSALFVTVATTTIYPRPGSKVAQKANSQTPIEQRYNRYKDPWTAHVVVQLVNHTSSDDQNMLLRFGQSSAKGSKTSFSLIEFPGVLLPAFEPTLNALQRMSTKNDMPFADILAPVDPSDSQTTVPVPAYARGVNFSFDISCLSLDQEQIRMSPRTPIEAATLSGKTSLDVGQAQALISLLTRSFALIQGPPGTGKSYTGVAIMKVLLANRVATKLGPIVCVTYTNHALDQSLENLVKAGVKQIIRIGSRSKSECLADLNIREVARNYNATKLEKRERWEAGSKMEDGAKKITICLRQLHFAKSDEEVMRFLEQNYYDYYHQLSAPILDKEGYQQVQHEKRSSPLKDWLAGRARLVSQCVDMNDLYALTQEKRKELYATWIDRIVDPIQRRLSGLLAEYDRQKAAFTQVRNEVDLRVLSDAHVIGVTTSGLARMLPVLRKLKAKVLLVEEAGEVLEAHLLSAMLPSLEHAILIGDHQQLRPKVQNYELSCENRCSQIKLDISLFERLVSPQIGTGGIPFVSLEVQRRMHPSISALIRSTLYPRLQDGGSVSDYPEVSGMRNRLFWLDHEEKEDGKEKQTDSTSHTNQYEVDMVFALVRHLVRQGVYRPSDIAVLTPYLGQLRKLRKALGAFTEVVLNDRDIDDLVREGDEQAVVPSTDNEKGDEDDDEKPPMPVVMKSTLLQALRLATVDNFQGEEAKVVIISLVRSNEQRKCGFLRTSNRINVLLSRAQHGMYIIGNTETSSHVEMWGDVFEQLKIKGNVGTTLELCCPRHPDIVLSVNKPDDFATVAPEAGCDLMCEKQLVCGHVCVAKCHSDGMHAAVFCTKVCIRPKQGCLHVCPYPCGQECDKRCEHIVTDLEVDLPCGHHVTELPCWQYQDIKLVHCTVPVERAVPGCGHKITLPCHLNVDSEHYQCTAPCGSIQPCGHLCKHKCHRCNRREEGKIVESDHGKCRVKCGRDYTNCKHQCRAACHGDQPCPLCEQPCDVRCSHSQCNLKCNEPCAPCAEEVCASRCSHTACSMPCAAPCDHVPCSIRCEKELDCGHRCISVCGAECPTSRFCQICAPEDVKSMVADKIMFESFEMIDLASSPCLVTPCGHVLTVETLDGWMRMSDHYTLATDTGMPVSICGNSEPFSYEEMKTCPDCRGSLRSMARYGRIVRRALLDESTKKFIAWSNREYVPLAGMLSAEQDRLADTRNKLNLVADSLTLADDVPHIQELKRLRGGRYRRLAAISKAVDRFLEKVEVGEQPFMRVRGMVETVRRRRLQLNEDTDEFKFDETVLQTRGCLLASALVIRCSIVAVSDLVQIWTTQQPGLLQVAFAQDRLDCEALVERATSSMNLLQQVEGHIFWAHFAALEFEVMDSRTGGNANVQLVQMKATADEHLNQAKNLCEAHPGQTVSVAHEIDEVRRMLHEAGYQSQMRMVVAAMEKDFTGTGHWFRCANGHPFTIGECGMPMQTALCPQCGAAIGGTNHQAVAGVQHAHDIERDFAGMRI